MAKLESVKRFAAVLNASASRKPTPIERSKRRRR
jgi:hypothetical protein